MGRVHRTKKGAASVKDNELNIRATINYHFSDEFTDPASIREKFWGQKLENAPPEIINLLGPFNTFNLTELFGKACRVLGSWRTQLMAQVDIDATQSAFHE